MANWLDNFDSTEDNFLYKHGGLIKRADGSYSRRGLWDNIRANRGSGRKPTAEMLRQEKKIKRYDEGSFIDGEDPTKKGEDPKPIVTATSTDLHEQKPLFSINDFFMPAKEITIPYYNQVPLDASLYNSKGSYNPGVYPYQERLDRCYQTGECLQQSFNWYDTYIAPVLGTPDSWAIRKNAGIISGASNPRYNDYGEAADSWDMHSLLQEAGGTKVLAADVNNPHSIEEKLLKMSLDEQKDFFRKLKLPLGTVIGMGFAGGSGGHYGDYSYDKSKGLVGSNHTGIVVGYDETGLPIIYDYGALLPITGDPNTGERTFPSAGFPITNITIPKEVAQYTYDFINSPDFKPKPLNKRDNYSNNFTNTGFYLNTDKSDDSGHFVLRNGDVSKTLVEQDPDVYKDKGTTFIRSATRDIIDKAFNQNSYIDASNSQLNEILQYYSNPDVKYNTMQQYNISSNEYDAVIKNMIGIYGAETKFNTDYVNTKKSTFNIPFLGKKTFEYPAPEPSWFTDNLSLKKRQEMSLGPFQVNWSLLPKNIQEEWTSKGYSDLTDMGHGIWNPLDASKAVVAHLASGISLLRKRANTTAETATEKTPYSQNITKDNYLEFIPYLYNMRTWLKGDDFTKKAYKTILKGESEYKKLVDTYANNILDIRQTNWPLRMSPGQKVSEYSDYSERQKEIENQNTTYKNGSWVTNNSIPTPTTPSFYKAYPDRTLTNYQMGTNKAPMYALGSIVDCPCPPTCNCNDPIYVTDPNDPRLKAYNDSLGLYKASLINYNGNPLKPFKPSVLYGAKNPVEAYSSYPNSKIKQIQGNVGFVDWGGINSAPNNKLDYHEEIVDLSGKIFPAYTYEVKGRGTDSDGFNDYYEKPKQEVILREELKKLESRKPKLDFSVDEDLKPIAPIRYVPDPVRRVMNPAFDYNTDFLPNRTKEAVVDALGNPRYKYYNRDKVITEQEYKKLMEKKANGGPVMYNAGSTVWTKQNTPTWIAGTPTPTATQNFRNNRSLNTDLYRIGDVIPTGMDYKTPAAGTHDYNQDAQPYHTMRLHAPDTTMMARHGGHIKKHINSPRVYGSPVNPNGMSEGPTTQRGITFGKGGLISKYADAGFVGGDDEYEKAKARYIAARKIGIMGQHEVEQLLQKYPQLVNDFPELNFRNQINNTNNQPLSYEQQIDKKLGHPQEKAVNTANNFTINRFKQNLEFIPIDNLRHATGAKNTSEGIQNLLPSWFLGKGILGFIGANALGLGHEVSVAYDKYKRDNYTLSTFPFWQTVRESGEDMFNNAFGAAVGSMSFLSEDQKNNIIQNAVINKQLPDGTYSYDNPNLNNYEGNTDYTQQQKNGGKVMYKNGSTVGGEDPEYMIDPRTGKPAVINLKGVTIEAKKSFPKQQWGYMTDDYNKRVAELKEDPSKWNINDWKNYGIIEGDASAEGISNPLDWPGLAASAWLGAEGLTAAGSAALPYTAPIMNTLQYPAVVGGTTIPWATGLNALILGQALSVPSYLREGDYFNAALNGLPLFAGPILGGVNTLYNRSKNAFSLKYPGLRINPENKITGGLGIKGLINKEARELRLADIQKTKDVVNNTREPKFYKYGTKEFDKSLFDSHFGSENAGFNLENNSGDFYAPFDNYLTAKETYPLIEEEMLQRGLLGQSIKKQFGFPISEAADFHLIDPRSPYTNIFNTYNPFSRFGLYNVDDNMLNIMGKTIYNPERTKQLWLESLPKNKDGGYVKNNNSNTWLDQYN